MSVRRPAPPPLSTPREQYLAGKPTLAGPRRTQLPRGALSRIFQPPPPTKDPTPSTAMHDIPILKLKSADLIASDPGCRPTSARSTRPQSAKSARSTAATCSPSVRTPSVSAYMHSARDSVQLKGKRNVKEFIPSRERKNFNEAHQRAPVHFIQTEAAAKEAETINGYFLFQTVQAWIVRMKFDDFLKYRPLSYALNFNESVRSMHNIQQTSISHADQEAAYSSYEKTVKAHAQIEYFTSKRRNQYIGGTVALKGAGANRFSILRERHKKTGFPLPISYSKFFRNAQPHQDRHSRHPIAIVISAPKTPGVRCMLVGEVRHTIPGKLTTKFSGRQNLTTMTEKLQMRENRGRVDVNPAASLRLMQRMQSVAAEQKRKREQLDTDSEANSDDLEEAMQTILGIADEAEADHDQEEAQRVRQILKFALVEGDNADAGNNVEGLKKRSRVLGPEFQQTMLHKVMLDSQPLRSVPQAGPEGSPTQTSCPQSDETFAHYDDCFVTPQYLVVYRSKQNFTNEKEYQIQSIIQRRHAAGATEAAQALAEPDLKVLELTLQWHVPISKIEEEVQKTVNQRRLVIHSEQLSPEASEEVPLALLLRLLGNGVASIDVSHPSSSVEARTTNVVDYRHSFGFKNR